MAIPRKTREEQYHRITNSPYPPEPETGNDNPLAAYRQRLSGVMPAVAKSAYISAQAFVGNNVVIEENAQIMAGAHIGDGVKVMQGAVIGIRVYVGHGTVVGTGSTIGARCIIGTRVHVGALSHIGANNTIDDGTVIRPEAEIPATKR